MLPESNLQKCFYGRNCKVDQYGFSSNVHKRTITFVSVRRVKYKVGRLYKIYVLLPTLSQTEAINYCLRNSFIGKVHLSYTNAEIRGF